MEQSLSHIPVSKRGELLALRRMGLVSGMESSSSSSLDAYDKVFNGDPCNEQALRELFSPEGDVGPHKRHHRRAAARA